MDKKLEAFGFERGQIDGHDFDQMEAAFAKAKPAQGRAHRHPDEDHQGQGRQLHGEPGRLARQGPQRRGIRAGHDELKAQLAEVEAM